MQIGNRCVSSLISLAVSRSTGTSHAPKYSSLFHCLRLTIGAVSPTHAAPIVVPGEANPWLAGMPNGSIGGEGLDTAPAQSPISVTTIPITAGETLTFSASGNVAHGGVDTVGSGPDGESIITSLAGGSENGIAELSVPFDSLIGVFLDSSLPSLSSPPSALDFSTPAERDFLALSPQLRQPFFIGDGQTSTSVVQRFVVPAGATRLFLGTMDAFGWFDNTGQFLVTVSAVPAPEPSSIALLAVGLFGLFALRRRKA